MMKKTQSQRTVYTFRREQVLQGDVREFLGNFDPIRLSMSRLKNLAGNLILAFEGSEPCAVSTDPELRLLLRRLHAIWPWSGFFLNLERPIGASSFVNDRPLLAVGLSLSDLIICYWERTDEVRLRYGSQLEQYRSTCHEIADRLGQKAGISARDIALRHNSINEQFEGILS